MSWEAMRANARLFLSALGLLAASPALVGQQAVIAPEKRQALIESGERLLERQEIDVAALATLRDPFVRWVEEAAPQPVVTAQGEAAPVVTTERIPDRFVLRSVARQLKPRGVLRRGDDFVLLLENGRLTPGQAFGAAFGGERYRIEVSAITEDRFTLRLNRTEYTREITRTELRGHVSIDRP
jgi:hypothetical protein